MDGEASNSETRHCNLFYVLEGYEELQYNKAFFIPRQKSSFGAVCTGPRPARLFHSEFGVPHWRYISGKTLFVPANLHSGIHLERYRHA
jgi:hypothetical protein